MGEQTGISWTSHTFNPWWGCQKVSEACRNCYAEATDKRDMFKEGTHWGPTAPRRFFGDKHWKEPLKWDRKAFEWGERRRVFVASMADVFEDREDLKPHRLRLWQLIKRCTNLDWLLLTKRPQNMPAMIPWLASHEQRLDEWPEELHGSDPWPHVWLGVTAEDQEHVIDRVSVLRAVPAAVRFVSCEPILELIGSEIWDQAFGPRPGTGGVHWLIVGDESGHNARPADPNWVRVARDSAHRHRVAFHFKQWAGHDVAGIESATLREPPHRKIHLPILDGEQHAAFPR